MNEALFKRVDRKNDPLWVAKEFFNSINNMFFLRAVKYLIDGIGYGNEYSDCEFSGDLEEDEEPFEGVRFRYYDDEIVVSEETFRDCLMLACQKYGEMNPDKRDELDKLLSRL